MGDVIRKINPISDMRLTPLILLVVLTMGCIRDIDTVTIESVQIVEEPRSKVDIYVDSKESAKYLRFDYSSVQDLREFGSHYKLMGTCSLVDADTGRKYMSFISGPFHLGHDVSERHRLPDGFALIPRSDGRYEYSAFTLRNLSVWADDDINAPRVPIEELNFECITCYLYGWWPAPSFLIPTSNEWVVKRDDMFELVDCAQKQPTP